MDPILGTFSKKNNLSWHVLPHLPPKKKQSTIMTRSRWLKENPTVETLSGQSVTRVRSWRGWAESFRGEAAGKTLARGRKKNTRNPNGDSPPIWLGFCLFVVESDLVFLLLIYGYKLDSRWF